MGREGGRRPAEERFFEGRVGSWCLTLEGALSMPVQATLRRMRRYVNHLAVLCPVGVQWRLTLFPDPRWAEGHVGAGLPHFSTPRKIFGE
jgi:hypothetical protein